MTTILGPNGVVSSDDPLILARQRVVDEYCHKKGWIIANLTLEQIMEIRKQPDWQHPPGVEE